MPSKQTFRREGFSMVHCSIKDHGNDAIDMPVYRETCRGKTKFSSYRGPYRTYVEFLSFDG